MHPTCEQVDAAARERGLAIEIVEFAQSTRSAAEAALAIGCGVAQIVKSLCFVAGGRPVIALVGGADRLDEARLAAACGAKAGAVQRADAELVRRSTGFVIGGVPPFGHAEPLAVYVDARLLEFETVWAAAGTPNSVFAIAPRELVRASGGTVAELARER